MYHPKFIEFRTPFKMSTPAKSTSSSGSRKSAGAKPKILTPIVPRKPLTPTTPHSSTSSGLKEEARKIKESLKGSSLDYLRKSLTEDIGALSETIMDDDNEAAVSLFGIDLPPPPDPCEPIEEVTETSTEHPLIPKWYPHKEEADVLGDNTRVYLEMLHQVQVSDISAIEIFKGAECVGRSINCVNTTRFWNKYKTVHHQVARLELSEVVVDLAWYLLNEPQGVHPYLKCLLKLRPYLGNAPTAFQELEERATAVASVLTTVLGEADAHRDETMKFAKQVSNVSANLSGLQESFEQLIVKVSKLDLLPSEPSAPPSEISVPSTMTKTEGIRVKEIKLSDRGEYSSHYSIKINNNRIVSIIPPKMNPEIENLITFEPKIQQVILNLDQSALINKLCANPSLKEAFSSIKGPTRAATMKKLCLGLTNRPNQWIKTTQS